MTIMSDQRSGARTLALGTPENRPAWLRATEGETKWWVFLALVVAVGLQYFMPSGLRLHTSYIGPTVQMLLLIGLAVGHPARYTKRSPARRVWSQMVLALVAIFNGVS